ncbi:flagellar biosynthetic protein FliR [soil metagenome]
MIGIDFDQLWRLGLGVFWPFVRIMALFAASPVLSTRGVPNRFKVLMALALAAVVAPSIDVSGAGDFLATLLQQIFVGVVVGFAMRIVFGAIEFAVDLAGLQIGIGFATFVDPVNNRPTPIIGSFYSVLATLIFLGLDGHLMLIAQLIDSFEVVPVSPHATGGFDLLSIAGWGAELFRLGFTLALPIITSILICNFALGIMARVAPQLSIFSVGFSMMMIAGLLMIWLTLPYLGAPLQRAITTPLWQVVR